MIANKPWFSSWNRLPQVSTAGDIGPSSNGTERKTSDDSIDNLHLLWYGEPAMLSCTNEDERAERLLSQFPVYGSKTQTTQDWLSLGLYNGASIREESLSTNTASRSDDYLASQGTESALDIDRMRPPNQLARRNVGKDTEKRCILPKPDPWDYDEQILWRNARRARPAAALQAGFRGCSVSPTQSMDNSKRLQTRAAISYSTQTAVWGDGTVKTRLTDESRVGSDLPVSRQYLSRTIFSHQATPPRQAERFDSSRQHWMPDQLCKQCYSCDMQFTVFRRRHHCRLCGQVFCNSCSAFFVESQKSKSTIRVCQMCFDQVNETGGVVEFETNEPDESRDSGIRIVNHRSPKHGAVDVFDSPQISALSRAQSSPGMLTEQMKSPDGTVQNSVLGNLSRKRLVLEPNLSSTTAKQQQDLNDLEEKDFYERKNAVLRVENKSASGCTETDILDHTANLQFLPVAAETNILRVQETDTSTEMEDIAAKRSRGLGVIAANHLEQMAANLLRSHAPILCKEFSYKPDDSYDLERNWVNQLLSLATHCCSTVDPNVKKGDLLDIRPYCKIKVIPGGSYEDSAYLSGILFRKTVSHKQMAREIENPRIMLLSGSIEFTRTENRIASLETLFEQEKKYMEILVAKILKLNPDLVLVGRSVSRLAQELFLSNGVVLVQHVKASLLARISRQTGSTVISSTDHVMNQFGTNVLGSCRRFRLVTFRDSETWVDNDHAAPIEASSCGEESEKGTSGSISSTRRSIGAQLADPRLSLQDRQAALTARRLGDGVLDGAEAVKSGLAKRGVARTFIMLEGCPKSLGCTVAIRGSSRSALKQVKVVLRFLINVAYNLRLETSYLRERCASIRPNFELTDSFTYSSSLCVDYGKPSNGRTIRPWNGGNSDSPSSVDSKITALDHQSILITSIWMTEKSQCCPAEVKGICYYSLQDVALGQFLRDSCFNLSLKCQNANCKRSVLDHSLSFVHNNALLNIMVEELEHPIPESPFESRAVQIDETKSVEDEEQDDIDQHIATWTYCKHCKKVVTPLVYISDNTWKFSFGKFLEVFFYNRDAILNAQQYNCSCQLQSCAVLYFGCGKLAARFVFEEVKPFNVFVRSNLPLDLRFHQQEAIRRMEIVSRASSLLFVKFDKHIDKVSREARSLFHSAVNRPEHLQTVLSELNSIGSEVDHAAKTLQEKIASVSDECRREWIVDEALFRFPWFARRYLFTLMSAWNEKLSITGQAISAMRKLASSSSSRHDGVIGPSVVAGVSDQHNEELTESMNRLRQLNDHYARYNVTDITQVLPVVPRDSTMELDDDYDDEFDDPDLSIDVDADVLASRRRLKASKTSSTGSDRGTHVRPTKSLGTKRFAFDNTRAGQDSSLSAPPRSTAGGAVKSAINRFFNRGGRESDPYVVDLGIFGEGRPRLAPGVDGLVVPVLDDQWSTIIAYSLASGEYAKQFKSLSKMQPTGLPNIPVKNGSGNGEVPSKIVAKDFQTTKSQLSKSQSNSAELAQNHDDVAKSIERQMLVRNKSHIKHTFRDFGEKGDLACKFVCTSYWATQFQAVRQVFLAESSKPLSSSQPSVIDVEQSYVESLSSAASWAASGGKSGASFARTSDDRFVIKCISRTELQMFLDCAPAYFEYLSKAFFHGL
jgi:hypothetical protein